MTPLPNDCARCITSDGCPLAPTCRRTTPQNYDNYPTVYSAFDGGTECDGYWPEKELNLDRAVLAKHVGEA